MLRSLPQIRLFLSSMRSSNLEVPSGLYSGTDISHVIRQELCGHILCRHETRPFECSGAMLSQRSVHLMQTETVKTVGHS